MWPLSAARPFECFFADAAVSLWLRSASVMTSADATDHGAPGRFRRCRSCPGASWRSPSSAAHRGPSWRWRPGSGVVIDGRGDAADWMSQGQFSPKTAQLYELLLRLHLAPTF